MSHDNEERSIKEGRTPRRLLDELDRPGLLHRECGRLRDFMIGSSRLLAPLLPQEAEQWLQIAERYRQMQASVADLEQARVAAWEFLGERSCDFVTPEILAVRAVICLLYPDDYESGERWFETVHFFLDVSNLAANHERAQTELLYRLFPEYLVYGVRS